jgi:hypothetical protein
VTGELVAEARRRGGLRRYGCGTENEGAQARDKGFQDMTSASETGARRAPQTGSVRGEAQRLPFVYEINRG